MRVGVVDFDLKNHTASIWDDGDSKFSTTNTATIGKAVASALSPQNIGTTANQYVTITSHIVSQNDILAVLEELTGEKWQTSHKNTEAELKKANEELAKGNHFAAYDLIKALTFGPGSLGDSSHVKGGLWNDRLGLPKEDLKASIRNVLEA
jgi:hypothetical protein